MDGGGGVQVGDAVQGWGGGRKYNREKTASPRSHHGDVVKATAFQCGVTGFESWTGHRFLAF